MPRYKRECNLEFFEKGVIKTVSYEEFKKMLARCRTKQERAIFIILYFTGARPSELKEIKAKHVRKEGRFLVIHIPTTKHGKERDFYLPLYKYEELRWLYEYSKNMLAEQYLLWSLRRVKRYENKVFNLIERISNGRYSPYFFRHHRFSVMALKGANEEMIKYAKGARSLKSVEPYLHLMKEKISKIASYI